MYFLNQSNDILNKSVINGNIMCIVQKNQ